jgi:trigger factor
MAFDVETPSETQAKVRIRVAPSDVAGAVEHEMGHLRERVRLKGFRPGKAPKQFLQKRYGGELSTDVARRLLEDEVKEAIRQHHLHPIEPPALKEEDFKRKEDGGLEVELELEVVPDFPLGAYDKFSVTPPPIQLADADVERELEGLRRQGASTEPVADGLTADGDVVIADLQFQFLDGSSLPKFENRIIDTGAGLVDGVRCEGAIGKFAGARRGDVVKITMKLPADFPIAEHGGKTAVVDCTVKDVQRVSLPALDAPDFLEKFGAKSLDELKSKVRERLSAMLKSEQDRAVEELVVDQLIERHRFALPQGFVERACESERERLRKDLLGKGVAAVEVDRQILEHDGRMRQAVERNIRSGVLLDRIAEKEQTQVAVEELERQLILMGRAWGVEPQRLYEQFQTEGLIPRIVDDIRRAKVRRQLRAAAAPTENVAEESQRTAS